MKYIVCFLIAVIIFIAAAIWHFNITKAFDIALEIYYTITDKDEDQWGDAY